tara:strand:- start:5424 stop:5921 length:498 start_codon:yes stop_codon:yes gene_type:complete
MKNYCLSGFDELTGEPYVREASDADELFRANVLAHMAAWSSTAEQVALALKVDERDLQQFLDGKRGAPLEWVSRISAYVACEPAEVLTAAEPRKVADNVLAHLQLMCSSDEIGELFEMIVVAKRAGLLGAVIEGVQPLTDRALCESGEDADTIRSIARNLASPRN